MKSACTSRQGCIWRLFVTIKGAYEIDAFGYNKVKMRFVWSVYF